MKKRKGNVALFVLALLCVVIYTFFFEKKEEEPFVPHYYTYNGRDIYYQSKANQKYSDIDHYVLAVAQIPYAAESPRDRPSEPFGNEARNFVKAVLRSRDIHIECLGNSLRGDLLYVYVWLDEPGDSSDVKGLEHRMLNAQLISLGYSKYLPSRVPLGGINPAYEKVFLELQKEAQNKRIGIWSLPENSSETHAKAKVQRPKEQKETSREEQQAYLKRANTVVVTPRGKKYHDPTCRTVRGSYKTLTVAQARKRGYTPCKVCNPPSKTVTLENSNIYWGDNVYHRAGGTR